MIRQFARSVLVAIGMAALVAVSWRSWLGWHGGSYAPWQVAGIVVTLVTALVLAIRAGYLWSPAICGVAALVVVASLDWGTRSDGDGLWVIGVMMLAVGATSVAGVLVSVARRSRPPA